MIAKYISILGLVAVTACASSSSDGGGSGSGGSGSGGSVGISDVPADLSYDVSAVDYDPKAQTLKVQIKSLDSTPTLVTYNRTKSLDVNGYEAYSIQEDALDRLFIAMAKTSDDGAVSATVVSDGGQFNKVFAGGVYSRTGTYSAPNTTSSTPGTGQVSYAGNYVGLLNGGVQYGDATSVLKNPGDVDVSVKPTQSARVSGDIFLNANFADKSVNGSIYNRVIVDSGLKLQTVVLVATDIADNGTFAGSTETPAQTGNGSYAGVFGGKGATSVAGLVHLTTVNDGNANILDKAEERGAFVLSKCGTSGASAICDNVAK